MARIKLPDIKSGDTLSSSKFNEINDGFLNLEIDGSNIAVEGINQTKKPKTVPFRHGKRSGVTNTTVTKVLGNQLCYFSTSLDIHFDAEASETLEVNAVGGPFVQGEIIFVRANARIKLDDFGIRTWYAGIPPTISVQLRYRRVETDESSLTELEKLRLFKRMPGTKQLFSCAFSSKIASDSGGDFMVQSKGTDSMASGVPFTARTKKKRFDLITYGGDLDALSPSSHSDYDDTAKQFFDQNYSYTTAFPLEITSDLAGATKINIKMFGAAYHPSGDHPSSAYTDTGIFGSDDAKGCSTVKYKGFEVRNAAISAVRIRK